MVRKKAIVVFLLTLFSFQLLPLKQVGSVIYMNQLLEELPNSTEGDASKFNDGFKSLDCLLNNHLDFLPALVSTSLSLLSSVEIYSRGSDDIFTPPPNANSI